MVEIKSLLSLELSSVAGGYQVLKSLADSPSVRILEASPVADRRFFILASGDEEPLRVLSAAVAKADVIDREVFAQFDTSALQALYSLSAEKIQDSLVVVECATISGLLLAVKALSGASLKAIEIKLQRTSGQGGHAFFTGSSAQCEQGVSAVRQLDHHKASALRQTRIEHIENPGEGFRSFFNVSGEA